MTTTFFLLRHAAHDNIGSFLAGRLPHVFLGPAGRDQALRLGGRMRLEACHLVFSSPRERALETARAVSMACGIGEVGVREELDEFNFGSWSGKTFVELNADPDWYHWNSQRADAVTPLGESMEDVRQRMCGCMEVLTKSFPGKGIVLVSHADVIKCVICHVLGLPADRCFRFDIDPASISVVEFGEQGSRLIRLNETV